MHLDRIATHAWRSHHVVIVALIAALAMVCFGTDTVARKTALDPDLRLVVNVPAARLDVLDGNRLLRSYPVSPGTRKYPTPLGTFAITEITWNPWWQPPPSEWAKDEKRTPPGERNPMGRVKLLFAPTYFLHGTADTNALGGAASHGCIRIANRDALELARWIQTRQGPQWQPATFDSLAENPRATRVVTIDNALQLDVIYQRFELLGDIALLHPDVYGLGLPDENNAMSLLAGARPAARIDTAAVRTLLARRGTRTITMPLDSIARR